MTRLENQWIGEPKMEKEDALTPKGSATFFGNIGIGGSSNTTNEIFILKFWNFHTTMGKSFFF